MKQWRENPEEELARLIPTNEMTNFWSPNVDIMVNPGETAVIIREGAIVEVLTQQRMQSIAGGFTNWLGEKLNLNNNFDLLMVDNKPFQVEIGAEGLTMDNVAQTGTAKLTLRLNHENSSRIIGVLREKAIKTKTGFFRKKEVISGYETVLTRSAIEQMLAEEAQAKVFKGTGISTALKPLLKASILNSSERGIPSLVKLTFDMTSFLKTHIPLCESFMLIP